MNSFSIPKPRFQTVGVRRIPAEPQDAVKTEGREMIKALGWAATILVVGLLAWQIVVDAPMLPRIVSALLIVLISGAAGIRIGTDGISHYIEDVQRVNKVLAEQHRELEELNAVLLKQVAAETGSPTPSERV